MKVFVTGGTGVVGRRTVPLLVSAGHDVTVLARSDQTSADVTRAGATPARIDLFDAAAVADAVAGHDAVVNLATHIPPLAKAASASAWAINDRIRTEGSRNLVDAALEAGASRFVQESIVFPYADSGDEWVDEDTPYETVGQTRSILAAEGNTKRFAAQGGAGVVLRFALFYAADSVHTRSFVRMARVGIAPVLGPPENYFPSIHAIDAGAAVVAALGVPSGTYNVGDDEPLIRREWGDALCAAFGVRPRAHLPGRLAATLGGAKGKALARSQRISNRRFREAANWAPRYPSVREGFAQVAVELG